MGNHILSLILEARLNPCYSDARKCHWATVPESPISSLLSQDLGLGGSGSSLTLQASYSGLSLVHFISVENPQVLV